MGIVLRWTCVSLYPPPEPGIYAVLDSDEKKGVHSILSCHPIWMEHPCPVCQHSSRDFFSKGIL